MKDRSSLYSVAHSIDLMFVWARLAVLALRAAAVFRCRRLLFCVDARGCDVASMTFRMGCLKLDLTVARRWGKGVAGRDVAVVDDGRTVVGACRGGRVRGGGGRGRGIFGMLRRRWRRRTGLRDRNRGRAGRTIGFLPVTQTHVGWGDSGSYCRRRSSPVTIASRGFVWKPRHDPVAGVTTGSREGTRHGTNPN